MLSQKHAISDPSVVGALELGLAPPSFLSKRGGTMLARPALRFLLTTYPRLIKSESFLLRMIQGRGHLFRGLFINPH